MSGCGNSGCPCGAACKCSSGCSCGSKKTMDVDFSVMEGDCKCGANCACSSCPCHK